MNEFKRAREEYESTPIPEELDARVRAGIRQGRTSSRSRGYKLRMYRCWAGCSRS